MTRMSKQGERRAVNYKRPRPPAKKTGPKKDALAAGYKSHENVVSAELARFIPKVRVAQ